MKRRTPTGGDDSRPLASHVRGYEDPPSRIARSSVDRVRPGRDGSVLENLLVTSRMSSDDVTITVDADPLPLCNEGMLEMEATGERVKGGEMET